MEAWCTEHPWMTFFIIMAFLNSGLTLIKINYKKKDDSK